MRTTPYAARLAAGLTTALLAALTAAGSDAWAATSPTPRRSATPSAPASPRLPTPTDSVDPALAVGGPQLASMGLIVDLPAGVPAPPKVRDVSWVIADADTGEILAAKAPHARLLPASTAKVLTALVLLPRIPPTRTHVVTDAEASADGTRVGLVPGMRYTAKQLFQALLMASANDAAYALADMDGGRAATLRRANALAAQLGAHDTHLGDPSGLDAPGQTSSAYDLALIGRAALRNKDFRRYSTTLQVQFPTRPQPSPTPGKPSPKASGRHTASPTPAPTSYPVDNHNKLLTTYRGAIGVKNGFTDAAQRTNIAAATRDGKTYIVTEMHSIDYGWVDPPKLLDWAFAHGTEVTSVGRLVDLGELTAPPTPSPSPPPSPTPSRRATRHPSATASRISTPTLGLGIGAGALVGTVVLAWARMRARRGTHLPRHRSG